MLRSCKGIHCAGCGGGGGGILAVAILCLIAWAKIRTIIPAILDGVVHLIIILAIIAGITAILTAATITILYRFVVAGKRIIVVEALDNGYENGNTRVENIGQKRLDTTRPTALPNPRRVQVLSRSAYEWQERGQQQLSKRRDSR